MGEEDKSPSELYGLQIVLKRNDDTLFSSHQLSSEF